MVSKSTNLVLVPVHTSQRANVCKDVLWCVCELESIDIAKAELSINVSTTSFVRRRISRHEWKA